MIAIFALWFTQRSLSGKRKGRYLLRCFNILIRDTHGPTCWIIVISFLRLPAYLSWMNATVKISLQLVSQNDGPVDLGEVLSDITLRLIFHTATGAGDLGKICGSNQYSLLYEKIGKFLGKKSSLLEPLSLMETGALMQSCFLERAIITQRMKSGKKDRGERRKLSEKSLIEILTSLLKQLHCPRGILGKTTKFPNLDWMSLYPLTKIARDLEVLELWREALVRSAHDTSDIIDEYL